MEIIRIEGCEWIKSINAKLQVIKGTENKEVSEITDAYNTEA